MRRWAVRSFLLAVCLGWSGIASGQEDPFAASSEDPTASATAPTTRASDAAPSVEKDPDIVVQNLRDAPPKTPKAYAQAMIWLSRIKRFDEIGRYLDKLAAEKRSPNELAEMVKISGSSVWITLTSRIELSDAQRAAARSVLQAASDVARSPDKLNRWIQLLDSDNANERGKGRRELLYLEKVGIGRLAEALVKDEVAKHPDSLAAAFFAFGDSGRSALESMWLSDQPEVRSKAGKVLCQIADRQSLPFVLAILYSTDSTDEERQLASAAAERLVGRVPTEAESIKLLASRLNSGTSNADQIPPSDTEDKITSVWDDASQKLIVKSSDSYRAAWNRASQYAEAIFRFKAVDRDVLIQSVASVLQHSFVLNSTFFDDVAVAQQVTQLPQQLFHSPEYFLEVVKFAGDRNWSGAQVRAMQLMTEKYPDQGWGPDSIEALAKLSGSSHPAIRYAAINALYQIDPDEPYAGSGRVLETLLEMMRLKAQPTVLMISGAAYIAESNNDKLRLMGFDIEQVGTGRQALRTVDRPNPLACIVLASPVVDITSGQLVERLTRSRFGGNIPILVVVPENDPVRRWVNTIPQVRTLSVIPQDADGFQAILQEIHPSLQPLLRNDDRLQMALVAGAFLKRIAQSPDKYSFYDLESWEEEIKDAMNLPAAAVGGDALLSSMGSGSSQRVLADRVAAANLPENLRRAAAENLVHSIRSHGVRMDRAAVRLQYDRYNEMGPKDPLAGELLGTILDALEARAGLRDWPAQDNAVVPASSEQTAP